MPKENNDKEPKPNKKLLKIALACLLVLVGSLILITAFLGSGDSDFADSMYAKCLDSKVSGINENNMFSGSQKAVSDCEKVKKNALRSKDKYEQCLVDEKSKIGSTMKEYIDYLWGGYTTEGDGTGYYLKKPYEYYASKYETEDSALSAAHSARVTKCYNRILAN